MRIYFSVTDQTAFALYCKTLNDSGVTKKAMLEMSPEMYHASGMSAMEKIMNQLASNADINAGTAVDLDTEEWSNTAVMLARTAPRLKVDGSDGFDIVGNLLALSRSITERI